MKKFDYLIVGAGLFGAVAACELTEKGKRCLVIDKRDHIAGNIYTEVQEGIQVHKYGAHIFHTSNEKVWKYLQNFGRMAPFVNSPMAVYKEELYNLPFNMNTFSKMWGIRTPQEARKIIDRQVEEAGIKEIRNLEDQALSMVGKDIYEKLIKGYTEKQWGKSCKELPSFIIKRIPLRFTYDNNYFNDPYQGIPEEGYTKIVENMLQGVEVRLNTDYFEAKEELDALADKVIYTGQIDRYYGYRFGHLEYRSLHFESEIIDCDNYQGNAVINYTEREVPYTRIIEHKHFLKKQQEVTKKTILTREYPELWNPGKEPYYPVNDEKNGKLYEAYKDLADREEKVFFGGRLGRYQYNDMDKTIEKALELVESIEN